MDNSRVDKEVETFAVFIRGLLGKSVDSETLDLLIQIYRAGFKAGVTTQICEDMKRRGPANTTLPEIMENIKTIMELSVETEGQRIPMSQENSVLVSEIIAKAKGRIS